MPAAMLPLARSALVSALMASACIALAGMVAGAVRVLPWCLDPTVTWRVAAPFARSLAAVALEASIVVGWPIGWALACFRSVESGEARVLQMLGEAPLASVLRLSFQAVALALVLGAAALVAGTDASAPGRMATELILGARRSCVESRDPASYVVPFTHLAWLCAPGREPRLAGAVPGMRSSGRAVMTARGARIAGDFRGLELDDADIALPPTVGQPAIAVHVRSLSVHGMAPWARASTLPAGLRALLLALSAWAAACAAAHGVLRSAVRVRAEAFFVGAAGPLAALGLLRALERADARAGVFALIPIAALSASASAAGLASVMRQLSSWRARQSRTS